MSKSKTISLVIPTHRRGERVKKTVESVLSSTLKPDEIIVVEDTSHEAEHSLRDYIKAGSLRYFKNTNCMTGASSTRNFGVSQASMDFVLFLDDDDTLDPVYISELKKILDNETVIWGFGDILTDAGRSKPRAKTAGHLRDVTFRKKLSGMGAGFFINRLKFLKLGSLKTSQIVDEDTDICCRLVAAGYDPYYTKKIAVSVARNDQENRLTNSTPSDVVLDCYLQTLEANYTAFVDDPSARNFLIDRVHRILCKNKKFELISQLRKYERSNTIKFIEEMRELKYRFFKK